MEIEASSSSSSSSSLLVDDLYFTLLPDLFPISDENFALELQLQEAIASSLLASITMANKKPAVKRESPSEVLCTICTDAKSAAEMFAITGCSHSFCMDCMSNYIAAKLEDHMEVKCPEPKCAVALEPEMCRSVVPKEVLERWGDALFEAMILKTKNICCPFTDCSAMMIDDGEVAVTAVECPNCWRMFCAQCRVGWHGEMDCGEFQKLRTELGGVDSEDLMAVKLADSNKWKRCPNCKIYVDKIEGCLHITCRCGSEFCYGCGSTWSGPHRCSRQPTF